MTIHPRADKLDAYAGTHILFSLVVPQELRKTKIWMITDRNDGNDYGGNCLGHVQWFGRWRKYCFFPAPDCVFEEVCLREISGFIVERTKEHRSASRKHR